MLKSALQRSSRRLQTEFAVHYTILGRVSSRPMDAHLWKNYKENSLNLTYILRENMPS